MSLSLSATASATVRPASTPLARVETPAERQVPPNIARLGRVFRSSIQSGRVHPLYPQILSYRETGGAP